MITTKPIPSDHTVCAWRWRLTACADLATRRTTNSVGRVRRSVRGPSRCLRTWRRLLSRRISRLRAVPGDGGRSRYRLVACGAVVGVADVAAVVPRPRECADSGARRVWVDGLFDPADRGRADLFQLDGAQFSGNARRPEGAPVSIEHAPHLSCRRRPPRCRWRQAVKTRLRARLAYCRVHDLVFVPVGSDQGSHH